MLFFLILLSIEEDINIPTLEGVAREKSYVLGYGKYVVYKANSTILLTKTVKSGNVTVSYGTNVTQRGEDVYELEKDSAFYVTCFSEPRCMFSIILAKPSDDCNTIFFLNGPQTQYVLKANDFKISNSNNSLPICFFNGYGGTMNYEFINTLNIGIFKIYTKSLDEVTQIIEKGNSSGVFEYTKGIMVKFVPDHSFIDFLNNNTIHTSSKISYYHKNLASFGIKIPERNEFLEYQLFVPNFLELIGLYKNVSIYRDYESILLRFLYSNWSSEETILVPSIRSERGHLFDDRYCQLYRFGLSNSIIDSNAHKLEQTYYIQCYFQKPKDYLDSDMSYSIRRQFYEINDFIMQFFREYSISKAVNIMVIHESPIKYNVFSVPIYEWSKKIPCGINNETGKTIYLDIQQYLETSPEPILFWFEVLGMRDNGVIEALNRVSFDKTVYLEELIPKLHLEFKYVLKLYKTFELLLNGTSTTFKMIFDAIPGNFSNFFNEFLTEYGDYTCIGEINIQGIDYFSKKLIMLMKYFGNSTFIIFHDILNSIMKFIRFSIKSTNYGDFSTRLNKFIKIWVKNDRLKSLLESLINNNCNLINYLQKTFPEHNINRTVKLIESVLRNEPIQTILNNLIPEHVFEELNTTIFSLGNENNDLYSISDLVSIFSQIDPVIIRNEIDRILSQIINISCSIDELFRLNMKFYFNSKEYHSLTMLISSIANELFKNEFEMEIDYDTFNFINCFAEVMSKKTLNEVICVALRYFGYSIDLDELGLGIFSTIHYLNRNRLGIIGFVHPDLKPIATKILNIFERMNTYYYDRDIQIKDLLNCFISHGEELHIIVKMFVETLACSRNFTDALYTIPSSFIDIKSTIKQLATIQCASFINLCDSIIVNQIPGKIAIFDILPIDKLKEISINLNEIRQQRHIVLRDISDRLVLAKDLIVIVKYIKDLWTDKIRPNTILTKISSIDHSQLLSYMLDFTLSIKTGTLGPISILNLLDNSIDFIDKKDTQSGKTKPIIPILIIGAALIVIFGVFVILKSRKKTQKKMDKDLETTLI